MKAKPINIAIIPARMGSKGVPGKNLKKLCGTPLLDWTLHAAFNAGTSDYTFVGSVDGLPSFDDAFVFFEPVFDMVVVTSESQDVLDRALEVSDMYDDGGVLVPFLRSPEMSQDHVQTDEVCLDVIRSLELDKVDVGSVCLLQPTSPFRTDKHINESFQLWEQEKHNKENLGCLVSGVRISGHYLWKTLDGSGDYVTPVDHIPQERLGRQWENLPDFFTENGALYWFDAKEFSLKRSYRQPPFIMYEMDEIDSVDINTEDDWKVAEGILEESGWKTKPQS